MSTLPAVGGDISLITATALTLLVLPTFAARAVQRRKAGEPPA